MEQSSWRKKQVEISKIRLKNLPTFSAFRITFNYLKSVGGNISNPSPLHDQQEHVCNTHLYKRHRSIDGAECLGWRTFLICIQQIEMTRLSYLYFLQTARMIIVVHTDKKVYCQDGMEIKTIFSCQIQAAASLGTTFFSEQFT